MLAPLFLLTSAQGTADAAFPGKNGRIAFSTDVGGSEAVDLLHVIDPDGGRLRRISGDGVGAAFSPGGRRIAYATDYQLGIRVQRANGRGPERRLTTGYDYDPDWSPSGRRLVFTRYSPDGSLEEIWIRYASGERRLAEGGDPAWSVKGWIAFERHGDIYVVRPDGSRLRRVVRGSDPDWSPGGRRIVFTTHRGMISTVRPDGGGLQRLRSGSEPAFSPDGHKIVYIGRQGLTVMGSGGKHPRFVPHSDDPDFTGEGTVGQPDWQPLPR
jgi:Tol biopolymer transport system component